MTDLLQLNDATHIKRNFWKIADGVTYLNHGSFGPTPLPVQEARYQWSQRLAANPMNGFVRELDHEVELAKSALASFLKCSPNDLLFIENATTAMNVVAASFELRPGDEVLFNDHEYGAVRRIWERACTVAGAKLVTANLRPFHDPSDVIEPLLDAVTPRTRLVILSHVTSATATIFPIRELMAEFKQREIPVVIDGPHAIAMQDFSLGELGAAFYCASLHKWLCAPLGTGFLYVAPEWQSKVRAPMLSWGRPVAGHAATWQDELRWQGTRDPDHYLAVPTAIQFMESFGLDHFRNRGFALACEARAMLEDIFGTKAIAPADRAWSGTMVAVPLPPSQLPLPKADSDPLQVGLWETARIEAPVMFWNGTRHLRISCHLYNDRQDLRLLEETLKKLHGRCW
ncbi:Isopenicillin N epimerase [Planctopirus ephydatiae]|uniref:Isopenicillin N epimerase n=1 Tax=Planctopirus ephydatiae TaxID=2528019 RepID=A0A518GPI2_9PLAN|nr:aminotransferase class V-fold PLP-dependent enzyme [Planctopirus ephydatiae]QDV30528.1 Isopenicillin N epimerase [Planctopirus ephydatiae]